MVKLTRLIAVIDCVDLMGQRASNCSPLTGAPHDGPAFVRSESPHCVRRLDGGTKRDAGGAPRRPRPTGHELLAGAPARAVRRRPVCPNLIGDAADNART